MRAPVIVSAALAVCLAPLPGTAQHFEPLPRSPDVRAPRQAMAAAAAGVSPWAGMAAPRTSGEFPVLVIAALFEDSSEPLVSSEQLTEILFASEGRTFKTFYQEMSHGALTIHGEVTDWVRTHVTILDAAGNVDGHGFIGERSNEHFAAAVAAVDSVIDYRQYDSDGPDGIPDSGDDDGFVDAVSFKFTEIAGSCGGPGFWPHRWSLRTGNQLGVATQDTGFAGVPIRVAGYTTESAIECDGETPQNANVISHEFGHILGLPDWYRAVEGVEAVQRHWMVGCFGVMAAGSWGCGSDTRVFGFGPSGFSPLSRAILGWGEAIEVGQVHDAEYTLEPVQSSGQFLKIPLDPQAIEYLLIEYRPLVGFDDVLPAAGVLAYHVDEAANIFGGAYAETFPYFLVEADGEGQLRRTIPDGGDRGTESDVFARAGAVDSLTPATGPSTARVNGEPTGVWIHSIAIEGDVARIRITTAGIIAGAPVAVPATARALESMEVRYTLAGGTPPYEAINTDGDVPMKGLSTRIDGDDVVMEGIPLQAGIRARVPIHVRDADGNAWWASPEISFIDAELSDDQLLAPLLPTACDDDVCVYMDNSGNRDGRYDIGDLRAYVLRTGG